MTKHDSTCKEGQRDRPMFLQARVKGPCGGDRYAGYDPVREVQKALKGWDNRLRFEPRDVAKNYVEGRVELVVIVDVSSSPSFASIGGLVGPGNKLAAVFKAAEMVKANSREECWIDRADLGGSVEGQDGTCGDDQEMFVPDIQIVQPPKGAIRSFVQFKVEYDVPDLWSAPMYLSSRNGSLKAFRAPMEGEVYPLVGSSPSRLSYADRQQVESRPNIMSGISNNWAEEVFGGLVLLEDDYTLSGFRITLEDEAADITICKGGDCGVKLVDVAIGPL